jgi:hypothetical protein
MKYSSERHYRRRSCSVVIEIASVQADMFSIAARFEIAVGSDAASYTEDGALRRARAAD